MHQPTRNASMASLRSLPRTRGLPLVGALPALLRAQLDYFVKARDTYGDIYALDLGVSELVVLSHPRHAQHVLRDNARNYRKGGSMWESLRSLLGNGLPVSEGDFWRRQRRMMQPQFHRKRLEALVDTMLEAIDDGMAHWAEAAASGQPFDIEKGLTRVTLKVIVRTMFGTGLGLEEADAVGRAMAYVTDYVLRGLITHSLPRWLPVPGRARYQAALDTIDEIVLRLIDERRREHTKGDDLVSMLLDQVDAETGERMTDAQLRDEAVSIFLAGYETTSLAMAWSMHFLAQRPDVANALRAEVDALGPKRPSFADLPALGLAQMVVRESLRLYPPAYWIPRMALGDDEIDGFHIPAGATLGVMTYAIHRHPDEWERAGEFDPFRFSPERSTNRHGLAWMPFGAGQRQCIGNEFALIEGQLILARIMQQYDVAAVPGRIARPYVATGLRTKDGVWVRLERRRAAPRPPRP